MLFNIVLIILFHHLLFSLFLSLKLYLLLLLFLNLLLNFNLIIFIIKNLNLFIFLFYFHLLLLLIIFHYLPKIFIWYFIWILLKISFIFTIKCLFQYILACYLRHWLFSCVHLRALSSWIYNFDQIIFDFVYYGSLRIFLIALLKRWRTLISLWLRNYTLIYYFIACSTFI